MCISPFCFLKQKTKWMDPFVPTQESIKIEEFKRLNMVFPWGNLNFIR